MDVQGCLTLTAKQVFVGRNRIKILTKQEQDGMRKVCRLAREVLDIAARAAKPGVTTDYIDKIVHDACMEREVSRLFDEFPRMRTLTILSHTRLRSTTATSPNLSAHPPTKLSATVSPISARSRTATSSISTSRFTTAASTVT